MHKSRQTDIDLTVICLRFKMSLCLPPPTFFSWLEVLICSKLKPQAKWSIYFTHMIRVNFKLSPRHNFV